MKSMPKWFLIPPAVAALLILGTLSMQSGADAAGDKRPPANDAPRAAAAGNTNPTGAPNRREAAPLPRTPDLTQMVSALAGVLVLGIGGAVLLRRLRGPVRAPRGASLLSLRQTLRLSQRQAVHAIEFDDRILLVGESERGLTLLDGSGLPERAADEAEVAGRATHTAPPLADDGDDGAVPKNLVIPRPANPLPRRRPAQLTPRSAEPAPVGLADFRNLLQKAGRS